MDSLFMMKAVTLNERITTRDLFDVYTLLHKNHYPASDIFSFAERFNFSPDTLKTRLLHARKRLDDPGIETAGGTPPSFEQLQAYFVELIDRLEQEEATAAFRRETALTGSEQSTQHAPQTRRKRARKQKK